MAKARPWQSQILPPPIAEGEHTGPPDFVGIGAQRCGTSWWFDVLRRQPGVRAAPGKELHFFDWFADGQVPADLAERYHAHFPRGDGEIAGEWTPRYMADTWAIRLLHEVAPEAKLLVMVRDPVERYRSALARDFTERAADNFTRLAVHADALWRGFYAAQLERVFELFDRERVLVLQYERALADPASELARTCEFLGIPAPADTSERLEENRGGQNPKSSMPDWLRADLAARYREDSRRLGELVPEIDLSLWPSYSDPPTPSPVLDGAVQAPAAPARATPTGTIDPAILSADGSNRWLDQNVGLWDSVDERYRDWAVRYQETHRGHFAETLSFVSRAIADGDGEFTRVVDVGSVPGFVTALLDAAGFEVDAVDLDPDRIRPVYDALGVTTHAVDIEHEALPMEDGSADLVLISQVLEHLRTDPLKPIEEIGRILRPGGRAIVSVPNITPYMRFRFLMGDDEILGNPIGAQRKIAKIGHAPDSRLYSDRMIRRMLEHSGMSIAERDYGGGVRIRKGDRSPMMRAMATLRRDRMQGTRYFIAVKG